MLTALARWWRYHRHLTAALNERETAGYEVSNAAYARMAAEARISAGYPAGN
jgi:hypothetical protein